MRAVTREWGEIRIRDRVWGRERQEERGGRGWTEMGGVGRRERRDAGEGVRGRGG